MILFQLFYEFFKTGLFAMGGGLATLPFLSGMADRTAWFTRAQLADMVAVSESTPGPIGVNMATYAGYVSSGLPGALCATVGLVLPSVIIILIIAKFLSKFQENPLVRNAFYGIRPAVMALIAAAGWEVVRITLLNPEAFSATGRLTDLLLWKSCLLAVLLFLAMRRFRLHPILYIALSAVAGILLSLGG